MRDSGKDRERDSWRDGKRQIATEGRAGRETDSLIVKLIKPIIGNCRTIYAICDVSIGMWLMKQHLVNFPKNKLSNTCSVCVCVCD